MAAWPPLPRAASLATTSMPRHTGPLASLPAATSPPGRARTLPASTSRQDHEKMENITIGLQARLGSGRLGGLAARARAMKRCRHSLERVAAATSRPAPGESRFPPAPGESRPPRGDSLKRVSEVATSRPAPCPALLPALLR